MEDTAVVRKIALAPERPRRVTTQFAPERPAARWPWVIAAALLLAGVARPIDPARAAELATQARAVLGQCTTSTTCAPERTK